MTTDGRRRDNGGISKGPEKKGVVKFAETESFGFRVKHSLRSELDKIAEYCDVNSTSDLVRGWTIDKVLEYKKDPRYHSWLRDKADKAKRAEEEALQAKIE